MHRASRSLLLACLLTVTACDPPPAPPSAVDAATMNALLQRLDRLAAALEGAPRATVAASPTQDAPAERTIVAGDDDALLARIAALEAALTVLQRTAPLGAFARAPAFAGAAPPMRSQSVQQLVEQLARDEQQSSKEAFRSFFLLGPAQVLDRLGTPSDVSVDNEGRWYWNYAQGDRTVQLLFSQGVVVGVY